MKQAIREIKENFEIVAIPNKYKNTLHDLIDSLDTEFSNYLNFANRAELINKGSYNAPKSRDSLPTFLEKDCLDENISITLLEPAPKIQDLQVHQRHNIITLSAKSGKTQYEKNQQGRKDEKDKRGGKNGEGERNEEGHWKNKVNLVVKENGGFETSVYHYIIYKY